MKIKNQNIFEKFHPADKFDSDKFKSSLFNGKVLIPNGFSSLLSLIIEVENYFFKFFNVSINEFAKDNSIILEEKKIIRFQKSIKQSKTLYKKFIIFLKDLILIFMIPIVIKLQLDLVHQLMRKLKDF